MRDAEVRYVGAESWLLDAPLVTFDERLAGAGRALSLDVRVPGDD